MNISLKMNSTEGKVHTFMTSTDKILDMILELEP